MNSRESAARRRAPARGDVGAGRSVARNCCAGSGLLFARSSPRDPAQQQRPPLQKPRSSEPPIVPHPPAASSRYRINTRDRTLLAAAKLHRRASPASAGSPLGGWRRMRRKRFHHRHQPRRRPCARGARSETPRTSAPSGSRATAPSWASPGLATNKSPAPT